MSDLSATIDTTAGAIEAVAELARDASATRTVDDDGTLFVSPSKQHLLDIVGRLEARSPAPFRKRGTTHLRTADSLVQYASVHNADNGRAALYADIDSNTVVAVFNAANDEAPGWGDHRAVLRLRTTPEWDRWMGCNGVIGDQVSFAEHVEDCIGEIASPPGAELLELAQTFHATTSAVMKQAHRLSDGQTQVQYEETIQASAGTTAQLTIPQSFTVVLPPYEGTEGRMLTARLRYRINSGQLKIGYQLHRPDVVLRDAFQDVLNQLETATGLTPYHGTAQDVPTTVSEVIR